MAQTGLLFARVVPLLLLGSLACAQNPAPTQSAIHCDLLLQPAGAETATLLDAYLMRAGASPGADGRTPRPPAVHWAARIALRDGDYGPWDAGTFVFEDPPADPGSPFAGEAPPAWGPLDAMGDSAPAARGLLDSLAIALLRPDLVDRCPSPVTVAFDSATGEPESAEVALRDGSLTARLVRPALGVPLPARVLTAMGFAQWDPNRGLAEWAALRRGRCLARYPIPGFGEWIVRSVEVSGDRNIFVSVSLVAREGLASSWAQAYGTLVDEHGQQYGVLHSASSHDANASDGVAVLLCAGPTPIGDVPTRISGEVVPLLGWHDAEGKWRRGPVLTLHDLPVGKLERTEAQTVLDSLPWGPAAMRQQQRGGAIRQWEEAAPLGWSAYLDRLEGQAREAAAGPPPTGRHVLQVEEDAWWRSRATQSLASVHGHAIDLTIHALELGEEGLLYVSVSHDPLPGARGAASSSTTHAGESSVRDPNGRTWHGAYVSGGWRAGSDGRYYTVWAFVGDEGGDDLAGPVSLKWSGRYAAGAAWFDMGVLDPFELHDLPVTRVPAGTPGPLLGADEQHDRWARELITSAQGQRRLTGGR